MQYLQSGPLYAKHDVHIEDGRIVGARFMVQAKNIIKTSQEKDFVIDIRAIVEQFPFKVSVFNPFFIFVDQVRCILTIFYVFEKKCLPFVLKLTQNFDKLCLMAAFSIK